MTRLTMGARDGGFILTEANGYRSRQEITLTNAGGAAVTYAAGTVLGRITASGKYVRHDPEGADGTQTVAGILFGSVTVPATSDAPGAAVVRDAEVVLADLVWDDHDAAEQTAGVTGLAALGIIARS